MTKPSPASAPTNSAITAPMTASQIATLSPTKICGKAWSNRSLKNS